MVAPTLVSDLEQENDYLDELLEVTERRMEGAAGIVLEMLVKWKEFFNRHREINVTIINAPAGFPAIANEEIDMLNNFIATLVPGHPLHDARRKDFEDDIEILRKLLA